MNARVSRGDDKVKSLDNWMSCCDVACMGKKGGISQQALLRREAKKPFGPWEKRMISIHHELRPRFANPAIEHWREENYLNNRYSVQISDYSAWLHGVGHGSVTHLWIRHHTGVMPHSWADLQRIKNEIAGKDLLAVEVYPKVDDLVDQANIAHLWVMPSDYVLPFTL